MYIQHFKQGNNRTYCHIWCTYTVLPNPSYSSRKLKSEDTVQRYLMIPAHYWDILLKAVSAAVQTYKITHKS